MYVYMNLVSEYTYYYKYFPSRLRERGRQISSLRKWVPGCDHTYVHAHAPVYGYTRLKEWMVAWLMGTNWERWAQTCISVVRSTNSANLRGEPSTKYRSWMQRGQGLKTKERDVFVILNTDKFLRSVSKVSVWRGNLPKEKKLESLLKRCAFVLTIMQETWVPKIRLDYSRPRSKIKCLPKRRVLETGIRYDRLIIGEKKELK